VLSLWGLQQLVRLDRDGHSTVERGGAAEPVGRRRADLTRSGPGCTRLQQNPALIGGCASVGSDIYGNGVRAFGHVKRFVTLRDDYS
jgi:hypothetical protein